MAETATVPIAPAPGQVTSSPDQATGPLIDAAAEGVLTRDARTLTARSPASALLTLEVIGGATRTDLEQAGASVVNSIGSLSLVRIRDSDVPRLARTAGVTKVRVPVSIREALESRPASTPRRGTVVNRTGSNVRGWHLSGVTGAGVKVGIIDIFDPAVLDQQAASGELPVIGPQQRRCVDLGQPCPFGVVGALGGNAIAEIIMDIAPDATLYLGEVGSVPDFVAIVDWFAANGVTVVNYAGSAPFDGPGDGTGPAAAIVDYAVAKGMTWVNSVGNNGASSAYPYSGGYWRGPWTDADGDRFMEFSGADESLGAYCGLLMGLRWSDWSAGVKTDYDLWVSDFNISTNGNGTRKPLSTASQAVAGAQPLEGNDFRGLCNQNAAYGPVYDTNKDGFVSLWVQRTTRTAGPTTGDIIELMVLGGFVEHSRNDFSAAVPFVDSRNPGALSVGGGGGPSIGGASAGPTNDGRAKPDFVADDCNPVSIFTGVGCLAGLPGSGSATATAVGLVALASSFLKFTTPTQVVGYFRAGADDRRLSSAWLVGRPKTNYDGWGTMGMSGYPPAPPKPLVYVPLQTPQRILDTRPLPTGPIGVDAPLLVPPGGTVRVPVGGESMVINLTVVNATNRGFTSVYAAGQSYPGRTANLNLDRPGMTRSNMLVVEARLGYLEVYLSGGGYVVLDVVGNFREEVSGFTNVSGKFRAWPAPGAVVNAEIPASTPTTVPVVGFAPPGAPEHVVPADATAVAVAVTVTPRTSLNGFISLTRGGFAEVRTAIATFAAGKPVTTTALVTLDSSRALRLLVSQDALVRIDVVGYITEVGAPNDPVGMFVPLDPIRALDSRKEAGPLVGGADRTVDFTAFGVPAQGASHAWLNVVALGGSTPGTLTSGSDPNLGPVTLSYAPDDVIGAASFTSLTGSAARHRPSSTTHLVVDLFGYFLAPGPKLGVPSTRAVSYVDTYYGNHRYQASTDGRRVILLTDSRLQPGVPDFYLHAYVWDEAIGGLVRHLDGLWAIRARANATGTKVLFTTDKPIEPEEGDFDTDLYWYDLATGATTKAFPTSDSNASVGRFDMSDDGTTIAFQTTESLVASDTDTRRDTYVWREGSGFQRIGPYDYEPYVSRDGSLVQVDTASGLLHFDVATGTSELIGFPPVTGYITTQLLNTDGSEAFMSTATQSFRWTKTSGWQPYTLVGRSDLQFLGLSADGRYMMVSGQAGQAVVDRVTNTATSLDRTWYGARPSAVALHGFLSSDGRFAFTLTNATNVTPYVEPPSRDTTIYRATLR